jgi:flagellar hook protein FlgE
MGISMSTGISISGLHAAQTTFDVMADNVANLASEGFKPSRVELRPVEPRSGVDVAAIAPSDEQGTDLATEMVGMVVARTMYAANARAFRVEDETAGALFDERA